MSALGITCRGVGSDRRYLDVPRSGRAEVYRRGASQHGIEQYGSGMPTGQCVVRGCQPGNVFCEGTKL